MNELICARSKDGTEHPPSTLICGLQCYIRGSHPEVEIFQDCSFGDFRALLNYEMKRVQRKVVGTRKRQTEPPTEEKEELWKTDQLGALVDIMLFMLCLISLLK